MMGGARKVANRIKTHPPSDQVNAEPLEVVLLDQLVEVHSGGD